MLTGVWAYKHNVWDNSIAAPNYHYWNIFRIVRTISPELKLGVFSSWEDNRTKLIGEGLPAAGGILMDFKFDGLEKDTVKFPHDKQAAYMSKIDAAVSEEAARVILQDGPDLSWVYLEFTDDMGHRFGDSRQFYDAVKSADRYIGKIWEVIKKRQEKNQEDWCIIVTTDHGRTADTGKNHGGQSERERTTWIATNAKGLNEHFKTNAAAVDILPTLCRHLRIKLPDDVSRELDGVSLVGDIEISDLQAERKQGRVSLTWKNRSGDSKATLDIQVTSTNHFKEGGRDEYKSVGKVRAALEKFEFDSNEKYLKVVLRGKNQTAAVWVEGN